jgi:hypothetical protein
MRDSRYRVLVALAALALLAGCGGRSGWLADRPTAAPADPTAPAPSRGAGGAAPGGDQQQVVVNRSYWYQGYKVTLGTARRVVDGKTPVVLIEGTFQNLSSHNDHGPTTSVLLSSNNGSYDRWAATSVGRLPASVPPKGSRTGTFAIEVDDRFTFADAVLTVGEPRDRQAVVPLAHAEGLVSLEPRTIAATGRVDSGPDGTFFMTVSGGEVRADDPESHAETTAGQEFVIVNFSSTNNSPAGFAYVFDRDLNLRLPDGSKVGTDVASHAQIYAPPHASATGGVAIFAVPVPVTGDYVLIWNNRDTAGLRIPLG